MRDRSFFENRDESLKDPNRSYSHTPNGRKVEDHDKLFVPYLDDLPGSDKNNKGIDFNERRTDLSPDKEVFYENMKQDRFLRKALEGIDLKEISDDEFAILLVWTAPLVTKIAETTLASQRARSILGVTAIEAQGLVRKTENQVDNLISIVETFHKHQKTLPEEKFLIFLKGCVYNMEKAIEIKGKIKELGEMWTVFKRDLQLKSGSQFLNMNLQKPIPALKQVSRHKSSSQQITLEFNPGLLNIEILIRVLPYWDTPLAGIEEESLNIRKLISLSKSEARNICDNFKVSSIGQLLGKISEALLRHKGTDVEDSIAKCLFNDRQKSKDFTKALSRIAYEKNSAHPTFVSTYLYFDRLKKLENGKDPLVLAGPQVTRAPGKPPLELFFMYYKFPLTAEQINSLCFYVIPNSGYTIHSISFKDIKISDACLIEMKKFLVNNKWKGTRSTTKGLYFLELYNNNISIEAFTIFCEAFLEKIGTNKI